MAGRFVAAVATAAFISGGLTAAALGVATGAAQAAPLCSPADAKSAPCAPPEGFPTCNAFGQCGQIWCPASGMDAVIGWDMNVCHTFYFDPNAPTTKPIMISGNPPGPPPPPRPPCIQFINCLPGLTHP